MVTERKVNFNDNIQIVYYETNEKIKQVNYEFAKNEKIKTIKTVKTVKTVNIVKCIKKIFCKFKNFM